MINIGEFNIELHNSIKKIGIKISMYSKYLDDNEYKHYILMHDSDRGAQDIVSSIVIKPIDINDVNNSIKGIIKNLKKEIIENYKNYPYKYAADERETIKCWINEKSKEQKIRNIKEKMKDIIEKALDDCIEEVMDTFKKEADTNETNN